MRLKTRDEVRQTFLHSHDLNDSGQRIWVYFGGSNTEYFEKALPKFLEFVGEASDNKDFSNMIIVMQKHPTTKDKNVEDRLVKEIAFVKPHHAPSFIISDFTSDEAQVMADAALFYQTSMAPQFVLAGIPVMQIGHETYADVLVRNNLCTSVTSAPALIETLDQILKDASEKNVEAHKRIEEGLGIQANWKENLINSLDSLLRQKKE